MFFDIYLSFSWNYFPFLLKTEKIIFPDLYTSTGKNEDFDFVLNCTE